MRGNFRTRLNIVYILPTLGVVGGLERIETEKMNLLAATGRYNVFVVCVSQRDGDPNAFCLSPDVRQVRLGQVFEPQAPFPASPLRFISGWMKWRRESRKCIKDTLRTLQPDVVVATINHIPTGFRRLKVKTIIESHCCLSQLPRKLMTLCAVPFGVALYGVI